MIRYSSHMFIQNLILLLFSVLVFDNQTVYSSFTLTFSVISECLTIDCYILKRITNQLVDVYIFIWIRLQIDTCICTIISYPLHWLKMSYCERRYMYIYISIKLCQMILLDLFQQSTYFSTFLVIRFKCSVRTRCICYYFNLLCIKLQSYCFDC